MNNFGNIKFSEVVFANEWYFYLLFALIPLIALYIWRFSASRATLQYSTFMGLKKLGKTIKHYIRHMAFVFSVLSVVAFITALARPQVLDTMQNQSVEGIDIIISIDVSTSMLARDFKPDRLEAAKNVAMKFISGRQNDRIGVVVFSGESYMLCPLTTDHSVLLNQFQNIKTGLMEDGTAIGTGLGIAIRGFEDSKAKSKVIILLTDGENNAGEMAPKFAASLAKEFGIRIYTIGVGRRGMAPYPFIDSQGRTVYQEVEVKIDEETMEGIANESDGKYFRATDNASLAKVYEEIDKLEKVKINVSNYSKKNDLFQPLVGLGCIFLLMSILINLFVFRNIP
ncbi:MAG: vWA domain-containing protein [Bacteroidales bacterium]